MRNVTPALTACAAFATLIAACGGAGSTAGSRSCALRAADSVFASRGPVYRDCAVDRPARLLTTGIRPDFSMPPRSEACYMAEVEFVVDTTGLVELATARIARTNHPGFAGSLLAVLPRYRFEPARRAGIPVRQITKAGHTVATTVVVAPAGSGPPPPPRGPAPC